jgi:hypothetical protein
MFVLYYSKSLNLNKTRAVDTLLLRYNYIIIIVQLYTKKMEAFAEALQCGRELCVGFRALLVTLGRHWPISLRAKRDVWRQ